MLTLILIFKLLYYIWKKIKLIIVLYVDLRIFEYKIKKL